MERSIGTVVHLALEELSRRPNCLQSQVRVIDGAGAWRCSSRACGVMCSTDALKVVVSSITQALQSDHIGRWVLSSGHAAAHSEWALTTVNAQGVVKDIVIDRSFIDRETGQRWVIDYKNSRPARGESLDDFVARESANYLEQLRFTATRCASWVRSPCAVPCFLQRWDTCIPCRNWTCRPRRTGSNHATIRGT